MSMYITGSLKLKKETQTVSDRFKKREFVITDNSSQYPQHISFVLTQDRCNLLDGFQVGDNLTVHFNLRGREWTSPQGELKYFNTLEAWRLERGQGAQSGGGQEYSQDIPENITSGTDDLPF